MSGISINSGASDAQALSYAKSLVEGAKLKAGEILQAACIEREQALLQAQKDGFNDGQKLGLEQLSALLQDISNRYESFRLRAVELVLTVAEEVLATELRQAEPDIMARLESACRYCYGAETIRILLAPDDLPLFIKDQDAFRSRLGPFVDFSAVSESSFPPGKMRIETPCTSIELDREEHWNRLKAHILNSAAITAELIPALVHKPHNLLGE